MKSILELSAEYELRINRFQNDKKRREKISNRIVAIRMVLFIATVFLVYYSVKLKNGALLLLPLLLLAVFLYLVKKSVAIRREISYYQILIEINQNEIRALQGDFTPYDPGACFIDYQHEYSFDLDIFGEHSIFRMVNRVATPLGREKLAGRLLYPGTDAGRIRQHQEAAKELKNKLSWRQDFLATARESDWEPGNSRNVRSWLEAPDRFSNTRFYKSAIWINALITITITTLYVLNSFLNSFLTFSYPSSIFLYFLVPISLIISQARRINREQQKLENLLDLFRKYAGMLLLIEHESFGSAYLKDLKKSLELGELPASRIMKKLTGILWGLEVRGNLIVSFILNSFFLWDILLMIRLERWRKKYHKAFGQWIDTIAEFETLNSLANLSYNRPDFNWPGIGDGPFRMEIVNGGHPLINPLKRVDNSLFFDESGKIYLITGANMAGKSTLLRMTGVNMILAMAGGPVCAERFEMVPVAVHTSVRTNDSLKDDESYFYAELKKLSHIINRLQNGEKVFVVIDEMLKGTNSRDKHSGSAALISRLIELQVSGLVATHDVELGKLETKYPAGLANWCFEAITDDNLLKFDYLLRPGVSQNLNATFLMRKMGIIGEG